MEPDLAIHQVSRGEKEAETAATRLIEHIEEALTAVTIHSSTEVDSLVAGADRIERAARDLSTALRELARERHLIQNALSRSAH